MNMSIQRWRRSNVAFCCCFCLTNLDLFWWWWGGPTEEEEEEEIAAPQPKEEIPSEKVDQKEEEEGISLSMKPDYHLSRDIQDFLT